MAVRKVCGYEKHLKLNISHHLCIILERRKRPCYVTQYPY